MARKIEVTVEMVPVAGKSSTKKVKVAPTGATVGEVLKSAGIDPAGKEIRMGGKSVDLDAHVGKGSALEARDQVPPQELEQAKVTVTERPQGS